MSEEKSKLEKKGQAMGEPEPKEPELKELELKEPELKEPESKGQEWEEQEQKGQEQKRQEEKEPDQQSEEQHLADCLAIIRANIAAYEKDVAVMSADIQEMYQRYHDNDPEIFTELSNTITMNENMKMALAKNKRALAKPYFGRIDIKTPEHAPEIFYLGKGGVMKDRTEILIVDWRAPIANVYYENGLGMCSYIVPGGAKMTVDLERKRTYEIADGQLLDYYDSEVVANDELLTKYLAKNKEAVLGEIIATIQKEQNDIIRTSPYCNLIVQGVAGSGKTTVAMHRISYILYNYENEFKPQDFYIIGSNRILLNYITGVLPELDVHGVKQMTMEQIFVRLLYEDWNEKKYRTVPCVEQDGMKGTARYFAALRQFCSELENNMIARRDVCFGENVILSAEQIGSYLDDNPGLSIQSKILMLNERVLMRLKNEIAGRDISYTPERKKEIIKEYTGLFGGKKWKESVFDLYDDFLRYVSEINRAGEERLSKEGTWNNWEVRPEGVMQSEKVMRPEGVMRPERAIRPEGVIRSDGVIRQTSGDEQKIQPVGKKRRPGKAEQREYDVYDLAALAYLYKRVKETNPIREATHIVIDEAQDYGMMAYEVLHYCIPRCTYTIMGDVSQNIRFGFGLGDWEELKGLVLSEARDSFRVLSKSYRNTVEISDFAQNILRHGSFSQYPIEPIIRHGSPVEVARYGTEEARKNASVKKLREWQQAGYDTIAVICRDESRAAEAVKAFSGEISILDGSLETAEFKSGIMVLPVEYTKGLEFDAVLLYEPTADAYPGDDGHAKLLYVAATRALHELFVVVSGEISVLLEKESLLTLSLF